MLTGPISNSFLNAVQLLTSSRPRAAEPVESTKESLRLPGSKENPILPIPRDPFSLTREDSVSISEAALVASRQGDEQNVQASGTELTGIEGPLTLSREEKVQVEKLRSRDREVRAHEQAHLAAGAGVTTGGPSYTYQTGPDGKRYAVGGEVPVAVTSGSADPEERIRHAQRVRAAATAPSDPSGADLAIAAQAAREVAAARAEQRKQDVDESRGDSARALVGSSDPVETAARESRDPAPPLGESESARVRTSKGDLLREAARQAYPGAASPHGVAHAAGRHLNVVA